LPASVSSALADLARTFSLLGRRWYVFGAQAVAAAGVPRFTADIDVTVEATPEETGPLLAALRRNDIVARETEGLARFVAETRVLPAVHVPSTLPIDIVLAGPGLEEEMLGRVRMRRVGRLKIPFIDTADLVSLKLLAGRPKDLEDVRGLLRTSSDELDVDIARERIAMLGALLEDPSLARSFEQLLRESAEETTRARPKRKTTPAKATSKRPTGRKRPTGPTPTPRRK
jgi:hypothetical protein